MQGKSAFSRLRELGAKLVERDPHRVAQGLKCREDPSFVAWPTLLEEYVEGELEVHVHFQPKAGLAGTKDLSYTGDFCAAFQWPRVQFDDLKEAAFRFLDGRLVLDEAGKLDWDNDDPWSAMLVPVPHFVQDSELVALGASLPTVIRLQRLEVCDEAWGHSPELVPANRRPILRVKDAGEVDVPPLGERPGGWDRLRRRWPGVLGGQRPDEVVEDASEVVDRVADEEAELCWRLLQERGVDRPLWPTLMQVKVGLNRARIIRDVSAEGSLQRTDVNIRVRKSV